MNPLYSTEKENRKIRLAFQQLGEYRMEIKRKINQTKWILLLHYQSRHHFQLMNL